MDTNAQIELKQVVLSAMNILDEDESNYKKYFQIAIEGLRDFKLHHIRGMKTVELEMDSLNRISLPDDCIRIVAIGIPFNGKLFTFTLDDEILRNTTVSGGLEIRDDDEGEGNVTNEEGYGYSTKGGVNEYYYTVDYYNRKVIISGDAVTVTLHYISSGVSIDGTTYIPAEAYLALRSYLIYMSRVHNPNVNVSQRQLDEKVYKEEVMKLRRLNTPSLMEIKDAYLKTFYATVKR